MARPPRRTAGISARFGPAATSSPRIDGRGPHERVFALLELACFFWLGGNARVRRRPQRLVGMAREADSGFGVVVVRDVAAGFEDRGAFLGEHVRCAQETAIPTSS